jgi:hypothetical protein
MLLIRKYEELSIMLKRLFQILKELYNNINGSTLQILQNFIDRKDELKWNGVLFAKKFSPILMHSCM